MNTFLRGYKGKDTGNEILSNIENEASAGIKTVCINT